MIRNNNRISHFCGHTQIILFNFLFGLKKLQKNLRETQMGSGSSVVSEHRTIIISPDNLPLETIYPHNRIASNKYTLWNFIPKNLFEQFRRVANFYFLVTATIAMSIESPISPWTSALPLCFVIFVSACKQGYEDFRRYRLDQRVNQTLVTVIRNKCLQNIYCQQIVVGDLVKVNRDEDVPCDMILLHSNQNCGSCYITTSNLDGETNLKALYVPQIVSAIKVSEIVSMTAVITCQHPLADLYGFHGKLKVNKDNETTSGPLTVDNLLLRGSRLKDTEYVIGCAVYTGQDTKLSLNSKLVVNKFSTAEKSINKYLSFFIILLLIVVFTSVLLKQIIASRAKWDIYLGVTEETFSTFLNSILSFLLLYNYIVPISLYVTVELQKFLGALFFIWDTDIYDETSDQPALSNTSDLNEELGQVEYLFADKTGTLTENLMVFRRCFINGRTYMEKDCDGNLYLLTRSGNEEEAVKLTAWHSEIWHFWLSLSICHVVHIAHPSLIASIVERRSQYRESFRLKKITNVHSSLLMDPSLPEYQAASADEKALVEASARCGVVFQSDSGHKMEIRVKDQILVFKKLEILEFTSERKRMSVIIQDSSEDIWLYCKGADTSIFPLIVNGNIQEASTQVSDFSMRGLRTLVVGFKKLKETEYHRLMQNVEHARQIIGEERAKSVANSYEILEKGLTLIGVTAVEDRLQEGVPETMESLKAAGIKIWVLTGDKAETAENIAFFCGHFKKGTEVLRLMDEDSVQSCFARLTSFERKIIMEPLAHYGLIVDGTNMAIAYKDFPNLLRNVGQNCEAVVCCRMSPLQKSEVVQLIKNSSGHPITAAIGDGGNDVSMIKEAHIGIGIMGKEGRQATMNADLAFAKFKFLRKTILVHGHWYYIRISTLIQYFFYKNLMFVMPQLFFGIHNGFSEQVLYDSFFLMCYNITFTSLPILMYGLLEQNYRTEKLLRYPHLYLLHTKNRLLSTSQFGTWFLTGLWQACVIYFLAYCYWLINPINLYDSTAADHWTYSTCILHIIVLVVNIQLLIHSFYWTLPFILSLFLSEAVFLISTLSYSSITLNHNGQMFWVFHELIISPTFWLLTVLSLIICLIPDFLIMVYNTYRPLKIKEKSNHSFEERINETYIPSQT